MLKFVVTSVALSLLFVWKENRSIVTSGINGTFFSTKPPYHLASLVWWDGKLLGSFPSTEAHKRGGLICYKDGRVEAGYFSVKNNELYWNGRKMNFWDEVKWAMTGGGLFLLDGRVFSAKEVSQTEGLSLYITTHRRYSFIAVHKDRRTITLGVSLGWGPPSLLARKFQNKYYAILRLDGGSQTAYWVKRKTPKFVHNGVAFLTD